MSLEDLLHPWVGVGLRHVPAGSTRSVLDARYAGVSPNNRWNEGGTPTFYFGSDIAVVVAEFARQIDAELPGGAPERQVRRIHRVPIKLDRMIDLTDPRATETLGIAPIREWIGDVPTTQATVRFLRKHLDVQGLIVPSVPSLDVPGKWNVVVFLDRIDARTVFGSPEFVRKLVLDAIGER